MVALKVAFGIGEAPDLADARSIVAAAENKADEIGQPTSIAVVDPGQNLISHARQDGGVLAASKSHQHGLDFESVSTTDEGPRRYAQPKHQFCEIHVTQGGGLAIFAGGVPMTPDGAVTGGLGSGEHGQIVALEVQAASRTNGEQRRRPTVAEGC